MARSAPAIANASLHNAGRRNPLRACFSLSFLRIFADEILHGFAMLRPRVRATQHPVKLNLGSGIEVAPGWINLDASVHALIAGSPRAILSAAYRSSGTVKRLLSEDEYVRRLSDHRFIFCDITRELPFAANTVDFIFCSHVLEHLDRESAAAVAKEALRVLKPGGWLRVCVPDLARAIRKYQEGEKAEALRYFYTGEQTRHDQHRYMYDSELLCGLLRDCGFVEVAERRYREGALPDLDLLDNRPAETLYVEGRKGSSADPRLADPRLADPRPF